MCHNFRKRKLIALVLIVSQLIVNAGMQTFAVSFSKIVDNTLDAMQQPENISTKYYEEFYYESKTYLLNDGNEDNEDETNFDTANQNDEIENNNDDKENDGVGASETTVDASTASPDEETTVAASETTVGASTVSPNEEDDDDEPDTQEYEEEPEEDTIEYEEEPEEDETDDVPTDGDYEDVPEEILDDETTVDETEEDVETTEESGDRETRPYDDESEDNVETEDVEASEDNVEASETTVEASEDNVEASTRPSELLSSESEESATKSPWGTSPEEETTTEVVDIASDSEANDLNEETLTTEEETTETVAETETNIATTSEITNEDIELIDLELASPSKLMKFGGLLGATPIGGDGTHVHKICGVAEGAACLHTEVAEHTEVGDYRLIAADENEIMAEVIDNLIGRVDDGNGNYEYITEPEYLVLGRDIEFDKSVVGNPRDTDTTRDFYSLDIKRDLYLCLNGHSIKNFTWGSSSNKQIFITNCGAPAEVSAVNLPADWIIISSNTKFFGVNKNIIVKAGRLALINNAERAKSTFFGTIFDGYNTVTGVQNVFDYAYDVPGHVLTFEDCEIRNYKNDAGTAQAVALIRVFSRGTILFKNVKIYGNDGIQNQIYYNGNSKGIGYLTIRGRCEIYDNNLSTGTTPTSFLHMQRTTLTIEDDGLFVYNNSKIPGHCYANISANATVNIAEGATFSIDNNKLAKNTANNHTIFVYMAATVNARGNFYVTNNKIINCGTSNTGEALAGLWVYKDCPVNVGSGIVKIQDNKAYSDDGVTAADDRKYKAQHLYQVYGASKDTTEVFKMIDGYKFNPANRIGPVGFPSGQSGKIMKFTTTEVDDPSIVGTVFKVDTYYFKDYVVEVKDDYARAVHKESNHKHKECGLSMEEACTHKEVASHSEAIMYYELSGDLAISGRTDLIKGFSSTDATEYFYLSDDIDNSEGTLISITLLRDVFICLNGHSMKGVRFAKGTKTVHICNCQNNNVTLSPSDDGKDSYMFDCNAYLYGKQNKNVTIDAYGIGRINKDYGSNIYIYGADIKAPTTVDQVDRARAYVNIKNGHFKLENTDIHAIHTRSTVFMYINNEAAGGFFTIRDVNAYDMSNIDWQIVRLKGNSGAEGTFTIKGNCSFYNINMTNTNANLVYADGYTSMTLEEGATLNLHDNNIQSGSNSLFAMASANSRFIMKENSKLIINNNVLGKTAANQGFLLFNSSSHELLGDVVITNNSFHNCQGKTSDYIGAFLASKDANITIGSGKIFIDNNKAYLDEGVTPVDDRAVPQHHMYGFITGKTNLALVQSPGTKFSPETYIPNFAFMGYSAGTVAKWTENEYEEYYKASFSELVVADTTYTPDFKVVYEENNLVVKSASTHFHKVCGVAETEACLHTEIDEHTENYQWSSARVDSVDAFVQSITGTDGATGSSYYYLSDDIVATTLTTITPKRDVYLCLNGHDLKNFLFRGTKSIYITNCQTDLSTIENRTTNLTFDANVYIYGIDDNILFSSNRVCDVKSNNTESHFFNLIVDGQNADSGGSYATFYLKNDSTVRKLVIEEVTVLNIVDVTSVLYFDSTTTSSKAVIKNVEIKDCSSKGQLIYISNSGPVEFKGKNLFHNNIHSAGSNMFHFMSAGGVTVQDEGIYMYDNVTTGNAYQHANIGKKFTIVENATVSFVRNTIKKYGKNRSVTVYVEDGTDVYLRGNFEVRDNKIINAGTQTNNFVAGLYILAKDSINIGNGRLIVKDNKCYSDNGVTLANDSEYVAQHMFNLLSVSKDVNLFNVIDGCKLNPETRIEGAAFYSAAGTGKIVDWTSEVTDDMNAYKNMFIPDKFFNTILDRRVKNNTVVLDYDEKFENVHNHKICGISTRSACTHTLFENHTEGIPYKPLSENVVKDKEIFITLITDQTGGSTEPNYFYLTTDLIYNTSGEAKKINFDVDTYICLNGHTIRGYQLLTQDGKFMNITNCNSTMGVVQLNHRGNLPFSTNTRVYGVNKNITLKTPRLCYTSTLVNEFYSFILDPEGISAEEYHVIRSEANSKVMIEDVDFKNLVKPTRIVNVNDGVANTNFVFKNITVKDGTTGAPMCQFYFGDQTTCNIDIYGKFEISGNNFKLSNAGGGLFATNAAKVTIHDGATLSISDNVVSNRGGIFYCYNGNVTVEAGGKLSVSGNTIYKNTNTSYYSGNTEIVYIGGNQKFSVLGDLAVVDNKIVNCGTNGAGTYMSALSLTGTNNSITVGNGNITINNNKAYSDAAGTAAANDRTYKNHHLFQVYSYNTKLVFKQASGTKFNTNSRMTVTMQGISEGKVVDWNSTTTDNISAYSSIFTTDYFGDEDPMLVVYKNDSVQLVSSSNYHFHKICGAATSSNCSHTLVTTRHENVEFSRLGTSINADSFVSLIKGVSGGAPEYFYLRGDITSSSEKEIALQRDVYLCLNGHSISGFRFTGSEKKIYICNCRDNKVSTIKNVLSSNILFTTNVQIYGSTRSNVVVNSGRVLDVTNSYKNSTCAFYNVDFNATGAKDIKGCASFYIYHGYTTSFEECIMRNFTQTKAFLFQVAGGAIAKVKNVTMKNNSNFQYSFMKIGDSSSNYGTLDIEGYLDVLNNQSMNANNDVFICSYGHIRINDNSRFKIDGNKTAVTTRLFGLLANSKFTAGENSYFGITNCTMTKVTANANTGIFQLTYNSQDVTTKGEFVIENNKIINCGTSTAGSYLYAAEIGTNRYLNIGSKKIRICNNVAYKDGGTTKADDKNYKNHHLYQVYANYSSHKTNGLIKVQSGHKLNSESKVEGIYYDAYNYNGNVIKWDSTTVDDADINRFSEMFTADAYKDDELSIGYDATNGWVIIEFGAPKHRHKLCGVATTSDCAHTAAASHGDQEIGYRKLTKEADRSTLTSSLAQGGAFVLLDDIDPAALGDNGAKNIAVTVSNDLYLCLNGHSLKGITFTGGPTKSVFITNCSTKKGTFENKVNSVAAFTNISAEINGINKNIDVLYDRLAYMNGAASNNQRIRLYSASLKPGRNVKIADPYIYITQSSNYSSSIEDCDFENMNAYALFRSDGNRTVRIKNNTFKNMTLRNFFMSFDKGTTKLTFEGNNVVDNIRYANETADYFIHLGSYAGNEVTIDGNLTMNNNESYYNSNHFFHIPAGKLNIKENSKLTMNGNKLYNTAIQSRALLYTGDNVEVSLMGSLEIKGNAFVGTRQSHSDFGFRYGNAAKPVKIGSTSIVITNNTTTNARANVRDFYSYYSSGALEQTTGTTFNVKESRIDRVAVNSEDYTGEIYNTWNRANVTNFDDVTFDEVFGADDYAGRKGIIVAKFGEKIIITFGDHFHKVCGTLATESCVHPGIEDHGMGTSADVMKTYLALRWGNMNELKSTLEAGGTYFLIRKIKFDTPTVIDVRDGDLILCLKGFYIENAIFTSSTGKKIYISTCVEQIEEEEDEEEEIEYDDDGQPILSPTSAMGSKRNDRNEVALVATASGMGAMFKSDVEIYSPHRLLNIYANKLYESSNSGDKVILSGVNLHNDEKTANGGDYIDVTGENEITLNNVIIATMSNAGYVVKSDKSTLKLSGDTEIYQNTFKKGLFDVYRISQVNGSVKIHDNYLVRQSGEQNFIKISTGSELYGELEAINNKVIYADGSNNAGRVSILSVASPSYIRLGNTKMHIEDNYAYSDGGNIEADVDTYLNHYVYGIFSNNFRGIFRQDEGTRMNASSKVNVSFAEPKHMGTVVKDWTGGDECENIFVADHNIDAVTGYNREKLHASLDGGDVVIDNKVRIYFKEGKLEKLRTGISPISYTEIAYYGEPYMLRNDIFEWRFRHIKGYVDEYGKLYSSGYYPTGLVSNRGKIVLTALWSDAYAKDDWDVQPFKEKTKMMHEAVIVGGEWQYNTNMRKWMYYLNGPDHAIKSLFAGDDAELYMAMSGTDLRGYMRNGIYQIYWNGAPYYFRFDENGYMVTGLCQIDGDYYYFTEDGILKGAMQFAPMTVGNKKYIFDVYGRIVREQDITTGEVQILSATYQKMIGMDDYYDPIPSLVGWN